MRVVDRQLGYQYIPKDLSSSPTLIFEQKMDLLFRQRIRDELHVDTIRARQVDEAATGGPATHGCRARHAGLADHGVAAAQPRCPLILRHVIRDVIRDVVGAVAGGARVKVDERDVDALAGRHADAPRTPRRSEGAIGRHDTREVA